MAPEQALITVVALLWGPTAIWILYRLARGRSDTPRLDARKDDAASGSASPSNAVKLLVDDHGFWVCSVCRSFNRPEARRCYGCGTDRDLAIRPVPAGSPGTFLVPVMAEEVGAQVPAVDEAAAASGPWREEIAAAAPMVAGTAALGMTVGVPVMADGLAAAGTPVLVATAAADGMAARGAPGTVLAGGSTAGGTGASGQVPSGDRAFVAAPPVGPASPVRPAPAPQVGPLVDATPAIPSVLAGRPADPTRTNGAVCPFLGLETDPSTWYEFPDPGNLCHAVRGGDASPLGFIRRLLTGRPGVDRLQLISGQQQRTTCLTAEHRSCGRYLAAMSLAARPSNASPVPTPTATHALVVAPAVTADAPVARGTDGPSAQPPRPIAWSLPVTEERTRANGASAADGGAPAPTSAPASGPTAQGRPAAAPRSGPPSKAAGGDTRKATTSKPRGRGAANRPGAAAGAKPAGTVAAHDAAARDGTHASMSDATPNPAAPRKRARRSAPAETERQGPARTHGGSAAKADPDRMDPSSAPAGTSSKGAATRSAPAGTPSKGAATRSAPAGTPSKGATTRSAPPRGSSTRKPSTRKEATRTQATAEETAGDGRSARPSPNRRTAA
jgi:hypothetical protein